MDTLSSSSKFPSGSMIAGEMGLEDGPTSRSTSEEGGAAAGMMGTEDTSGGAAVGMMGTEDTSGGAAVGMMGTEDTSGGQCVVGQPEETGATSST